MNLLPTAFLRRLGALLCLWLACAVAGAAPTSALRFQRLDIAGTDELSILALIQDRQGFVWIGTQSSGLFRYNGYQAVNYANNPHNPRSLPHDRVSALYEDAQGRIWAGTQNGLACFNPATSDFTRYAPPKGPNNHLIIKSIIGDGKGGMWLASWGGLQHFDPATGSFRIYAHDAAQPDSLASNDINALAIDSAGGLWATTWPGGIDYLPADSQRFHHLRIDSENAPDAKLNIARALFLDSRLVLWIGTENGVVQWQSGSDWSTRKRIASPNSRVTNIYADQAGTVWATTLSAGLLHWEPGQDQPSRYLHRANDPHSLPSDQIRAMMQDRGGMLWVATMTDGIALANLNSRGFERIIPYDADDDNPRPNNWVQSVAVAPGGRLWLGGNTGFSLFEPASGKVVRQYRADPRRKDGLLNDFIYSLYQQPGGPLWVGSSNGLYRLDRPDGAFQVKHFDSLASDFINIIVPGSRGTLWVGTGNSLIHYDPASGSHQSYRHDGARADSRSVKGTTAVLEDRQGRVWAGSEWDGGGLDLLDTASGRFRHFVHQTDNPAALSDDNVSSLYETADGRLWVGTAKGLNEILVGPGGAVSFRNYASAASVGHVKILAMASDRQGKLWLSTVAGLTRLDPATGKVSQFTASDGLTEGFSVGDAATDAKGVIYFGGLRGVTAVHPEAVHSVSEPPQVAITDISVFNHSLSDGKLGEGISLDGSVAAPRNLTLSVRQSVFSLEFAALHYTDPAQNRYAYRLDGFDRDWVHTDAAHRSATYTNLNPGTYVFQVKAANDRGVWNEQPASMTVTILPPYWQTWWFRTLASLLAVGTLASAYRIRVARLTRHQAELEALVAARTSELEESNRKLAALSTTDALTGIRNRRAFDTALASEWRRLKRTGQPLALAMLDVDFFKKYNDHYGHQAGDDCLRAVAGVLAAHARRPTDLAARYGGEEFVLLAPELSVERMLMLGQEICEALARQNLPHANSPYGFVSVSVGVAAVRPIDGMTPDMLVQCADQALYRAKFEGRNRACAAQDEAVPVAPSAPALPRTEGSGTQA